MNLKRVVASTAISLSAVLCTTTQLVAQQPSAPVQLTEEQVKAKAVLEEKALALLEQIISESQVLKLPENRIRVQITAADLLWEHNESRARALCAEAASRIAELMRSIDGTDRQYFNLMRLPAELRQELVLTVARYDSTLAYQIVQLTRQPPPSAGLRPGPQGPGPQGSTPVDAEATLERNLLAAIAATDPKLALQNAEELLEKGQYSSALATVLAQLQRKDKEAAAKFQDKLLKKLQAENLLTNQGASNLAMSLLRPGPKPADAAAEAARTSFSAAPTVLSASEFRALLELVIGAAFKATPNNQQANRGNQRGGPGGANATPTAAQMEQNSARGLLMNLQSLLPTIDQMAPGRASAVRMKLTELGMLDDQRRVMSQMGTALQQNTSEGLLTVAASAPPELQPRLFQQAAMRALDEGNVDRARQIAERLEPNLRASFLQTLELQIMARTGKAEEIEKMRQTVSRLRTDDEKVRLLVQLAGSAGKQNQKLALDLLEDAKNLVARRPSNYQQFESQLRVARAFAELDPARSVEVLESGIGQLNDLLPAAAILSGFDVNIFKDGELPLQGNSALNNTINRYAQELSALAKNNFELAVVAADKFQLAEARLQVRLAISRAALGKGSSPQMLGPGMNGGFDRGFGPQNLPPPPADRRQP